MGDASKHFTGTSIYPNILLAWYPCWSTLGEAWSVRVPTANVGGRRAGMANQGLCPGSCEEALAPRILDLCPCGRGGSARCVRGGIPRTQVLGSMLHGGGLASDIPWRWTRKVTVGRFINARWHGANALQDNLTENPRFSASESQVAWDTEPNPFPWSDLPGIPCNGDLARADRPGILSPMSRIGLDGILSLSAHAASHVNNPRQLW